MRSLRWRIAMWYAILLVAVLVAVSAAIALQFQNILQQQVEFHVHNTMQDIERAALPQPGVFNILEPSAPLQALLSSENLTQWSGPTTYVQIDSVQGLLLAKSSNMGDLLFPPPGTLAPLTPRIRRVVLAQGAFLIEDELFTNNGEAAVVEVGEPMDQLQRAFVQTRHAVETIVALAALAVVIFSFVLAAQATQPIDRLTRAMREIGSEGLHRRLHWRNRRDEIGRLAESFDELLARLEEAFARERRFISDASHELKTPLTSISANAQLLARWGDRDPDVRMESIDTIARESAGLAEMVNGMLALAKAESGDDVPLEPVDLNAVARKAVESTTARAKDKSLWLRFEPAPIAPIVLGESHLLRQLLRNLIDNAIKFTERGGIIVRISLDAGVAVADVQDTGPGIDAKELPHIFERFYRTDKARSRTVPGTGLGLAIVRSIARVHKGKVEALRAPGGGTLFRLTLPAL